MQDEKKEPIVDDNSEQNQGVLIPETQAVTHSIAVKVNACIVRFIEGVLGMNDSTDGTIKKPLTTTKRYNWNNEHGQKIGVLRLTKFNSTSLGNNFIELRTTSADLTPENVECKLHILFEVTKEKPSPFTGLNVNDSYGRKGSGSFAVVIPIYTNPEQDSGKMLPWLTDETIAGRHERESEIKKLINTVVLEWTTIVRCIRDHPDYEYNVTFKLNPHVDGNTRIPYSVTIRNTYVGIGGMVARLTGIAGPKVFEITANGNLGDDIDFMNYDSNGVFSVRKTYHFLDIMKQMKNTISSGKLGSCFISDIELSVDRLIGLYY